MIRNSSMAIDTRSRQGRSVDVLTLLSTEHERQLEPRVIELQNNHSDSELSVNLNKQLANMTRQRDKLQKKRKLTEIKAEVQSLREVEATSINRSINVSDSLLHSINARSTAFVLKSVSILSYVIDSHKRRSLMSLREYYDKTIREHRK